MDKNIEEIEFTEENYNELINYLLETEENKRTKSEQLGKSLGTRIQSRIFLSRLDKSQIELAREDSERAIKEFLGKPGYERQLQYRAFLETEAGRYREALMYLEKSIIDVNDELSLDKLMDCIVKNEDMQSFNLMHYCRLMGEAALSQNVVAEEMYLILNKNIQFLKIITDEVDENSNTNHPMEVIHWKLGTYHASKGNMKAAITYYNKGIKILQDENFATRQVIKLAIMCEKLHFISIAGQEFKIEAKRTSQEIEKLIKQLTSSTSIKEVSEFVVSNFKDYKEDALKVSRTVGY